MSENDNDLINSLQLDAEKIEEKTAETPKIPEIYLKFGDQLEYSPRGDIYYPLCPGIIFKGVIHFSGRIKSTRGGAWTWEASGTAKLLLNSAPYCPLVNGEIMGELETVKRNSNKYITDLIVHDDFVQCLITIDHIIVSPLSDAEAWIAMSKIALCDFNVQNQGHLSIAPMFPTPGGEPEEGWHPIPPGGARMYYKRGIALFNHYISHADVIVRAGNEMVIRAGDHCTIVSPHHLDAPISLTRGWYYLSHPLPQKDVD